MLRGFLLRLLYPRPVRTDFSLLNGGTSSFFAQHFNEVLLSPDPHAEMHRYTIESIALNVQTPQFEHLIVTVSDAQRTTSPNTGLLCIKCTASDEYITEYFSEHSESRNVLDAIISALEDSTLPSASPFSHQPSIDPTPTPSSTLDSESGPPPSPASQPTLVDPAPGTSTHTFYRSLASVTEQNDTKNFGHEQVVRRIKPKGLYLFELALLADVVHKQDRLYSLFQNQRYWYANLICDAVVALYTCKEQDNRGNAYCQDGVYIPPNNYLPKLAGQWKRIPVSDVEAAVLSVVLARFEGVRTQRIDAVRLSTPTFVSIP